MMHFLEDNDPESNRPFWLLMFCMCLVAVVFIIEIFVEFYLDVI